MLLSPLQCKEAISENSEQREEQIKNVLDKQLEKRMREMFAEMVSLNGECRKLYIIIIVVASSHLVQVLMSLFKQLRLF